MKYPFLLALAVASPAIAQDQPAYWAENGYYVFHEDKSCVLYTDYQTGTMLRISDRRDEGRIYFSAFNAGWEKLNQINGQTVTITILFNPANQGVGGAGVIVRNPDGRMGFSGNSYNSSLLTSMARSTSMTVSVVRSNGQGGKVEDFALDGTTAAIAQLRACSARYF